MCGRDEQPGRAGVKHFYPHRKFYWIALETGETEAKRPVRALYYYGSLTERQSSHNSGTTV